MRLDIPCSDSTALSSYRRDKLKKETIDISALVQHSVRSLQYKAKEKNQELQADLPGEAIYTNADKEKISRVLDNLISNAIKFSRENGKISVMVKRSRPVCPLPE